jgi:sugar phosphate isomerase/epimerase
MLTRRSFLATLGAFASAAVCRAKGVESGSVTNAVVARRRLDRVGIQLYSVRTEMQRDVPGTLARLAQIGYHDVEFAGYFGRNAAEIRQLLDANHLAAPSTHMAYDPATWDQSLDFAKTVGHEFVTVPWIDESRRKTLDDWRRIADGFNTAAERARGRGLRFAYHNHDFEFKPVEGMVPLDVLLERTDPSLVSFEMDVYWVTFAGADPKAYLDRYPTRFAMLHIKDSAGGLKKEQTDVGSGTIDFASILRLGFDSKHAVKHVFVEHDQPPDPMAFAKNSFDYLSKLEF